MPPPVTIVYALLGHSEVPPVKIQSSSETTGSPKCRPREMQGSVGVEGAGEGAGDDEAPPRSRV